MRALPTVALLITMAGCSYPTTMTREVRVHREFAVRNTVNAFRHFSIPVALSDELRGTVSSGQFRVDATWSGEAAEQRVLCESAGGSKAAIVHGPIQLRVDVQVRPTTVRGVGDPRTLISLRSSGEMTLGDDRKVQCRLTDDFSERIVRAIDMPGIFNAKPLVAERR